jgi:tRNA dimethylallyltransferase
LSRHLAVVGCTASGKSDLALALALSAGDTEIISLDSMQVYRGMDVGTAKPSAAEQVAVRHHLVDVVDPEAEWSVRETQRAAAAAIAEIEARGRRALFVGGTGLYVRAVLDGLSVPERDLAVRSRYEAETATADGLAHAYARLRELDPAAAARIEAGNRRRIVRALEVIETSGRPFSSFGPGLGEYRSPVYDVALAGVWLPRAELGFRIAGRVATMRDRGLVEEVRALAARPEGLSRTARQAIGYREVLAYLAGEIDTLDTALELTIRRTRQFARRQRVWFRRDPRIRWVGAGKNPERLASPILAIWRAGMPVTAAGAHA